MTHAGSFPAGFDFEMTSSSGGVGPAYVGSDVLRGLIDGMASYRSGFEHRKTSRCLGPAALGAFMSVDDVKLIHAVAQFPAACVAVSKQAKSTKGKNQHKKATFEKMRGIADTATGFPAAACWELADLGPRENNAAVLGPHSHLPGVHIPAFRSLGWRKTDSHLRPVLHTKMVLVGYLWFSDEGALGHVEDVIGFRAEKLWLSSANGTRSSRRSLEFGVWLTQDELLQGATLSRRGHSPLRRRRPRQRCARTRFLPFKFDDLAMAEAAAESQPEDDSDDLGS